MPVKPLLPALVEGTGPANLNDAGIWSPRGRAELTNISKILDVNVPHVEVNSIPTVWARPLLFEMALYDDEHKLHEQIVGEWRGLLALIALQEFNNLPVTVVPIDLSTLTNSRNEVLFHSLSKLIPRASLTSDTTWEHLFIILYNDKPIGITAPTTLVATATDYAYSGINVPWFDGKKLKSPVDRRNATNQLSTNQTKSLGSWLENLKKKLDGHEAMRLSQGITVRSRYGELDIKGAIDSYLTDLNLSSQNKIGYVSGKRTLGISGDRTGVFAYLDEPVGYAEKSDVSAIQLIPSRTTPPAKKLLIVDKEIAKAWHAQPTHVRVFATKTLHDLGIGGHPDGKHNEFDGLVLPSSEIWNATELFAEKLLLIRNENAFHGTRVQNWIGNLPRHNNAAVSLVLPINKKLLEYLTPEDLNERVTFEQTPNNEIKVRLRLTLQGLDDGPTDFTPQKVYSLHKTEDFEILDSLPILEVFPNFRRTGWKANYIAFSADNLNATFNAKPFNAIAEEATLKAPGRTGKRIIWRTDSFPEAIVCERGNREVGLLLLNEPNNGDEFNANKNYEVGVDFGASGTCVYASVGNNPNCLEFKNLKLSVTNKDADQKSELFDFFLPDVDLKTPFLSLFQPFHNEHNAETVRALLEGHVYYFEDKLATDIVPNLKWSDESDPKNIQYIKSFLTQLCIQTAAELVQSGAKTIEWKFSYPTAFFEDQAGTYKDVIWKTVIENVNRLCGLKSQEAKHFSESLASARYFRKAEDASTDLGAIFIDIGSSTSDVSVWQKDQPLWQTSLRYAGRDVFLNYLIAKPHILTRLLGEEKTKELRDVIQTKESEAKKWAVTDVILRKNSQGIFGGALGNNINAPEIKELRRYLAFGLGGLFYYLGLGVNSLIESGKYAPEMPSIHAGGNGALMFRWLTNGANIEGNSVIKTFFADVFMKGLNTEVKGVFSLKMSNNPKHEASHGLVRTDERNDTSETVKEVVAGEVFHLDGHRKDWKTLLDDKSFQTGVTVPDRLENLANYVEVFNEAAAKTTLIQKINVEDKLANVRSKVANTLGDLSKEKTKKVIVEPIFIIALKHLMEVIR